MSLSSYCSRIRVLIVDDNAAIHEDLKKILSNSRPQRLTPMVRYLAGQRDTSFDSQPEFVPDSAFQGEQALQFVRAARLTSDPYALAFVDMSMPPGWNGFQTASELLAEDPEIHIVLCTAGADFEWQHVVQRFGRTDRLLILKKPYDVIEVMQIAHAIGEKWHLSRVARSRLEELENLNTKLGAEVERRRRIEDQLRFDALHDALTRLPNRALLLERIEQCLRRKRREENYHFALVFFDLDDFKAINDTLGHKAGDHLLVEISQRILACVRSTDCASRAMQNTAARLGGDEFVILLDGVDGTTGAIFVTERILEEIRVPFTIDGTEVRPSASAGIAVGSERHQCADDLLRDADVALYDAKRGGKERLSIFDERLHQELLSKIRLETELRVAIEDKQLILHYQPIVDLNADRIHGFEALVRWDHPQHGRLPPSAFLPIAEEKGLIGDLGLWVLQEACRKTAEWRRNFPNYSNLTISVNFARRQLDDPDVLKKVERVLQESGLHASDVNIELTETLLMDAARPGNNSLERLGGHALNLHMDDFGSGLSSLSYLNRLPIRALKLDRAFVHGLGSSSALGSMLQALLTMAHARNLKVIAEGVETPEQFAILRNAGCDFGQGFYFCRPVEAPAIEEMLRANSLRSIA